MDVVVVGACMSDQTCFVDRLPRSGETVVGASYQLSYGGKGANQCVMAAKLGAATAMIAKVGDDSFGRMYIDNFRANGVNCDHVTQVAGQSTGVAQICVDSAGSNTIVIVPGANQRLTVDDVTRAEPIIAQASVVVCQLEVDEATTRAALQTAKKFNVATILNAAPAVDSLTSDIFNLVDILCVNETEAGTLLAGAPPSSESEALLAAAGLLARDCQQVIITLGANGAVLADRAHEPTHVPVPNPPARVIDTTGAGDAFVGALAYYCAARRCRTSSAAAAAATSAAAASAQLLATPEIVRRACHVAAISVTAAGAQTGQPTRHQLPSCLLPTAADQTEKYFLIMTTSTDGVQAELLEAFLKNDLDRFQKIVKEGNADLNHVYDNKALGTCIHQAVRQEKLDFLRVLVEGGADVNLVNRFNDWTPIQRAVEKLNLNAVKLLLEHGAQVNVKDDNVRTLLHLAVVHSARAGGNNEQAMAIAKELLKSEDCDIDCRDLSGFTALRLAVETKQEDFVQFLVFNGASLDLAEGAPVKRAGSRPRSLTNLLFEALISRDMNKFREVSEQATSNPKVLDFCHGRYTCLMHASLNNMVDYAEVLLSAGANPEAVNPSSGSPALFYAASRGHVEMLKLLVKHSPKSVGHVNKLGETVLHILVRNSSSSSVLLDKNSFLECLRHLKEDNSHVHLDVNRKNNLGETALGYAEHSGNSDQVQLLKDLGATR